MDEPRRAGAWIVPLAFLGAAAAYLALAWDRIPPRWPVHWDAFGRPNGWSERTPAGVYGIVALGAVLVLVVQAPLLLPLSAAEGAPAEGARRAMRPFVLATSIALSLLFSFLAIDLPLGPRLSPGTIVGLAIATIGIAAAVGVVGARRAAKGAESQGAPADGYHGVFYSNASDSRLWVPKRYGVGWTVNFAHPWAWPTLLALLAVPIAISLLAAHAAIRVR